MYGKLKTKGQVQNGNNKLETETMYFLLNTNISETWKLNYQALRSARIGSTDGFLKIFIIEVH